MSDWSAVVAGLGSGVIGTTGTLWAARAQWRRQQKDAARERASARIAQRADAQRAAETARTDRLDTLSSWVRESWVTGRIALGQALAERGPEPRVLPDGTTARLTGTASANRLREAAGQVAARSYEIGAVLDTDASRAAATLVLRRLGPFLDMELVVPSVDEWDSSDQPPSLHDDPRSVQEAVEALLRLVQRDRSTG